MLTARFTLDMTENDLRAGGSPTVGDSVATVVDRLGEALVRLPGAQAVGFASHLPRAAPFPEPLVIEGRSDLVTAPVAYQGPGLFDVLEVEPLLGRDFDDRDLEPSAPPVVVVNQAFGYDSSSFLP